MTIAPTTLRHRRDPYAVAAQARSILACPAGVELSVDGSPSGAPEGALSLADDQGRAVLVCTPGSDLLIAAGRRLVATVRLQSGLTGGSPDDALALTGRLVLDGTERCDCCAEEHQRVLLEPSAVILSLAGRQLPVPVSDFLSPAHVLNRGYLQRACEHANHCHGDQLRRAVSRRTGLPLARLIGASLAALTPGGVELRWVDSEGAHAERLRFPTPATDTHELGIRLREHLDEAWC